MLTPRSTAHPLGGRSQNRPLSDYLKRRGGEGEIQHGHNRIGTRTRSYGARFYTPAVTLDRSLHSAHPEVGIPSFRVAGTHSPKRWFTTNWVYHRSSGLSVGARCTSSQEGQSWSQNLRVCLLEGGAGIGVRGRIEADPETLALDICPPSHFARNPCLLASAPGSLSPSYSHHPNPN